MTRKLIAALAALLVLAVASLAWAQPAHAAPGGACAVEEWRNPGKWADCIKRAGQAVDAKSGCVEAPAVGSPTGGLAGSFTSEPDSAKRDGVQGQYSRYGVGGYGTDTYALGCLEALKSPELKIANGAAKAEFALAGWILGSANALRNYAYDPGSMWAWSDPLVEAVTTATYKYVYSVFGGISVVLLGLLIIWNARNGKLPQVMNMVLWAVFVALVTTGIAQWPTRAVHGADQVADTTLGALHSVLGPGPRDIAPGECALDGDACKDNRSVATRSSDIATEAILYRNWVAAVLGDADSETAKNYGPVLYDATAMQWSEASRVEGSPQMREQLLAQKAQQWNTVAQQIRTEDPAAFEHLQGVHGANRAGMGFIALGSAALFSVFDISASVVIFVAYGMIRFAVMLFPVAATFGLILYMSGLVRRAFAMVTAALFNITIFGAAAGAYLIGVDWLFRSDLPAFFQMVLVGIIGVIVFLLTKPHRKLISTVTGRSREKEGFVRRAVRNTADAAVDRGLSWPGSPDPADPGRPETVSTGRRFTNVFIPTIDEVRTHPVVAAATAAARPETKPGTAPPSTGDRVRGVVTAAATAAGGPAAGVAAAVLNHTRPPRS